MRRTIPVALPLIILTGMTLLSPAVCKAGPIGTGYTEETDKFNGFVIHGAISANAEHNMADNPPNGFGGTKWIWATKFKETEKIGQKADIFDFGDGTMHHKTPPPAPQHGEGENQNKFKLEGSFEAAKKGPVFFAPKPVVVEHNGNNKNHFDSLTLHGSFLVGENDKDIEAYTLTFVGDHSEERPKVGKMDLRPDLGSPLPGTIHGSGAWMIDPSSSDFSLSLAISGLSIGDLTSAQILRDDGLLLLDLDPASFLDVSGLGIGRLIASVSFPDVAALFAERTFLEIETQNGTIHGQLEVLVIPEPSTFALFCIGTIGLFAYGWGFRKRTGPPIRLLRGA